MKIRHKTLMYRIDKITLLDLDDLIEEACADGVPGNASVVVRIDGAGTHVTFEWVEQKVDRSSYKGYGPVPRPTPDKSKWYEAKPYFKGDLKSYKQF